MQFQRGASGDEKQESEGVALFVACPSRQNESRHETQLRTSPLKSDKFKL